MELPLILGVCHLAYGDAAALSTTSYGIPSLWRAVICESRSPKLGFLTHWGFERGRKEERKTEIECERDKTGQKETGTECERDHGNESLTLFVTNLCGLS